MGDFDIPTGEQIKAGTGEAMAFLSGFCPNGPWHLCAIEPDGPLTARTFMQDDVERMRASIDEWQGKANVYVHVNTLRDGVSNAKAKKTDVASVRFAHVDIDDADGLSRLVDFALPPTAIVFSGGGFNAYWLFSEPIADIDRAERINRWLVGQLDGDRAATDVSRILRVPGTINLPTKKKRERGRTAVVAYLVTEHTDWNRSFDPAAFSEEEGRPAQTPSSAVTQAEPAPTPTTMPQGASPWLHQLAEAGDDSEHPRGSTAPRYRSRSEAVWALACGLARENVEVHTIAGVLLNPDYRISESILEKRNPAGEAMRQAQKAVLTIGDTWPEGVDRRTEIPRRTFQNTQTALLRLGVNFWFDEFRQRMFVGGQVVQAFQGELNDRACLQLRDMVNKRFGFDPGKDMTRDGVEQLCNQNIVDPVCEYLAGLVWDGNPRLDSWLIDLAGAEDTAFVRAVSAIMLIAAVRRARRPGVKFDTIPVLEGAQGTGKSTLINILASEEFFSDQDIVALDNKAQMETLEGVWLYEICELAGMRFTDVNKIKSFASRAVDRARPAYARFSESRPRRGILVGTRASSCRASSGSLPQPSSKSAWNRTGGKSR